MQIDKSENYDLFMMRKLAIQLDGYISKFPDSPFALSLSGMYYAIKYGMMENETDIELGLENMLKSHSILKNSIFKIKDPLQEHANVINFEQIPIFLYIQNNLDEALKFVSDNKQMVCLDGTYSCLKSDRLKLLENGFYQSFQYNEAIELVELSLSRSEDELSLEGEDLGVKEQAYYRYGMINMKWGEHKKAIEGFSNALKINEKYITSRGDSLFWNSHYKSRLGLTYNLMGEYKKASQYYYKSYKQVSKIDEEYSGIDAIKSICPHGYMEILLGNHESAKNSITECVEWLNNNAEKIDEDYGAYSTYFPIYFYYDHLNDKTNAEIYLELAYKTVKEEKIKK